ncbi:MAG TPA: RNA chaperone Hfq [Terriglobales bacterium]|nr:RNA chaperone Hfq [Terriglobales bacterium]
MDKPAQNIQDSFLNTARKERLAITLYLLSGVKLTGRIRSFDKYCLILESGNQEQMIFKHAISTVVMQRVLSREHSERANHGPALAPPAAARSAAAESAGAVNPAAAAGASETS